MRPLLKVPTVSAIQKGVDCICKAKGIPRRSFTEWEMSIDFFFIYIGLGAKENKFKNRNLNNSRV